MDQINDIWYEETLLPEVSVIEKGMHDYQSTESTAKEGESIQGVVRVHKPRWKLIEGAEKQFVTSEQGARYYAIRLGFEFELPEEIQRKHAHYISAVCRASLWTVNGSQPSVYELFPQRLLEGEPQKVGLKLGVKLDLVKDIELSLGELSTEFLVGVIEPACIGYKGNDSREPHWELKPKTQALLGIHNFWLIVQVPQDCLTFRLAARAEATVQKNFGFILLTGGVKTRENSPSISIP